MGSFWVRFSGPSDCFQQLIGFVRSNNILFSYLPPPPPRLRSCHADPALRKKHLATRKVRGGRRRSFAPAQDDCRPAQAFPAGTSPPQSIHPRLVPARPCI